jgi:cytochrome P450
MDDVTRAEEPVVLPTTKTHLFDPPGERGVLRASRPLCRLRYADGSLGWLVTSDTLARAVLKDPRFGMVVDDGHPIVPSPFADLSERFDDKVNIPLAGLLALDPPVHQRYRRLVASYFTRRRLEDLAPAVEQIIDHQLDLIEHGGPPTDLMGMYASPVAIAIHCLMLGVPVSDGDVFAPISQPFFFTREPKEVVAHFAKLQEYLLSLIDRKRAAPSDDLISDIIAHGDLTDDEITSLAFNFMTGGRGSVEDMIGLAVLALLCHPEQLEALRAGTVPIDAALEELLRFIANFAVASPRRALQDVELEGSSIRAGEGVIVSLAAANRDPGKWDEPDVLDLKRGGRGAPGVWAGCPCLSGSASGTPCAPRCAYRLAEAIPRTGTCHPRCRGEGVWQRPGRNGLRCARTSRDLVAVGCGTVQRGSRSFGNRRCRAMPQASG